MFTSRKIVADSVTSTFSHKLLFVVIKPQTLTRNEAKDKYCQQNHRHNTFSSLKFSLCKNLKKSALILGKSICFPLNNPHLQIWVVIVSVWNYCCCAMMSHLNMNMPEEEASLRECESYIQVNCTFCFWFQRTNPWHFPETFNKNIILSCF